MQVRSVFKRYEVKYLVTEKQKQYILDSLKDRIKGDEWGESNVKSLYFDTPDFLLIRRSIEKPMYREKFRIRSYGKTNENSTVYVEIKKKFDSVVYKRRFSLKEHDSLNYVNGEFSPPETQITREADRFISFYEKLEPKVLISCDREAFFAKDDPEFRITFDKNILYRYTSLSLCEEVYGRPLLPEGISLMEVKTAEAMPLYMVKLLSELKLYKRTFSKYGLAYMDMFNKIQNKEIFYA